MSLISDVIQKNADVAEPEFKPIKSASDVTPTPDLSNVTIGEPVATPNLLTPEQQAPEVPQPQAAIPGSIEAPAPLPSGVPQPPTSVSQQTQPVQLPPYVDPSAVAQQTAANAPIWQNVKQLYGTDALYSNTILQTKQPTLYQPVADNSEALARLGNQYFQGTVADREAKKQREAQKAAATQRNAAALPNVPRVDKPWYAGGVNAVGGFFHDLLFGSEQQQQEAEQKKTFNPIAGEYADQGAGVGGLTRYLFSLPYNFAAGLVGEGVRTVHDIGNEVNDLSGGRVKQGYDAFRRATGIDFSKYVNTSGKQVGDAILGFDVEKSRGHNLLYEALTGRNVGTAADAYNKHEGYFYSPRYTYGESTSNIFNDAGRKIQADPLGVALDLGAQLLNPLNTPVDKLTGNAIKGAFRFVRGNPVVPLAPRVAKEATTVAEVSSVVNPASINRVQQAIGNNPKTVAGSAKILTINKPAVSQRLLPASSGRETNVSTQQFQANVGGLKPGTSAGVTSEIKQSLPNNLRGEQPLIKPAKDLPALPGQAPIKMQARLEEPYVQVRDPWTTAPHNITKPTNAPRIPIGETNVIQKALPASLPELDESIIKASVGTPSELTFNVGIGKPSKIPIPEPAPIQTPVTQPPRSIDFVAPNATPETEQAFVNATKEAPHPDDNYVSDLKPLEIPERNLNSSGVPQYTEDELDSLLIKYPEIAKPLIKNDADGFKAALEKQKLTPEQFHKLADERLYEVEYERGVAARKKADDELLAQSNNEYKPPTSSQRNSDEEILSFEPEQYAPGKREGIKGGVAAVPGKRDSYISPEVPPLNIDESLSPKDKVLAAIKHLEQHESPYSESNYIFEVQQLLPEIPKKRLHQIIHQLESEDIIETHTVSEPTNFTSKQISSGINNISGGDTLIVNTVERNAAKEAEFLPKLPDEEDLLNAAEELAGHKTIVEVPKKQLEEYFEAHEDFGRRPIAKAANNTANLEQAAITDARIQLKPSTLTAIDGISKDLGVAVRNSDHTGIASEIDKLGFTPQQFAELVNRFETKGVPQTTQAVPKPSSLDANNLPFRTQHDDLLFHGSAIKDFSHTQLDLENLSRGELGYGFHLTNDSQLAKRYSEAVVNGNANVATHSLQLEPNVTQYEQKFANTLDANAKIPSNHALINELIDGLTPAHIRSLKASLKRDADTTYNGLLNKVEAAMVKARVKPTEENLQRVYKTISSNLQRVGYDSVYDAKSGFTLALHPTEALTETGSRYVGSSAIDPMKAVLARYNADAYAAKAYPHRLTSDANLRDSTYRLLSQHQENIDQALRSVQLQLLQRAKQLDKPVLPELDTPLPAAGKNFKSVQEAFESYKPISDNPCEI